jgi:hypothetical protein
MSNSGMKSWPNFVEDKVNDFIKFIVRERKNDAQLFNSLPQNYILGRKVGKIPSASNDVTADDRLGDINYDADYIYILIDDSGAAWRRASLGSW